MHKFSTLAEHDAFYTKQLERERLIARVNKLAPAGEGLLVMYRAVDFEGVPSFINAAAREMLEYCYRKLGGLNFIVAWFENFDKGFGLLFATNEPTAGRHTLNSLKLWVRCDMPFNEILTTIAHEAHHCWFSRGPGRKLPYKTHGAIWEAGAEAFARRAVNEILNYRAAQDEICALRGQSEALNAPLQRAKTLNKQAIL